MKEEKEKREGRRGGGRRREEEGGRGIVYFSEKISPELLRLSSPT